MDKRARVEGVPDYGLIFDLPMVGAGELAGAGGPLLRENSV